MCVCVETLLNEMLQILLQFKSVPLGENEMLSFCPLQLNSSSQSKIEGKATLKDPVKQGSELYCSNRVQLSPTKMFVRVWESVKFSCQEKTPDDTNFKFTSTGVKLEPFLSGLSIFPLGFSFMIFFWK